MSDTDVEVLNYRVRVWRRAPDAEVMLWCEPDDARELARRLERCADEADRRRAAMGRTPVAGPSE